MKHHLTLAQYAILGAFGLFLIFILFFSVDGDIAGRATTGTTANISQSFPANCSFIVSPGYNIVSLACLTSAQPLSDVTAGTPLVAMYQYVPGTADPWKVYKPGLPGYVVSDLQVMTRRAGYIVIANGTVNKTIEGRRTGFTDVPVVPGWSLVGYPSFRTQNVSDALSPINGSYSVIVSYNKSIEQYMNYSNPGGSLETLVPGSGYWVNGTAAASWTVYS